MTAAHATTGSQTVRSRDLAIAVPDASLRPQTGERQGNPVQVRNGPAAVRGDASASHATGPRAGKAAREGAPSQKTSAAAATRTPRGRRIRAPTHRFPRGVRRSLCWPFLPHRRRSPTSHHLAVAHCHGDRSSPSAPASRSSPSTTSPTTRSGHLIRSSPASRRTSRRSRRTGPTSSSSQYDPGASWSALGKLNIRVLVQPSAKNLGCRVQADHAARDGDRPQEGGGRARRRMKKAIAKRGEDARRSGSSRLPRALARLLQATSKTFIGARSTSCSACGTSRTPPTRRGSGYPQLSGSTSLGANPALIVLADTRLLRTDVTEVASRPGWSNIAAVRTHSVVADRRLGRFALGAAHRELRAGGGEGAEEGAGCADAGRRAVFLACSVLTGVLSAQSHLGVRDVIGGTFAHVFGLHSPLSGADDAILWQLRLPRVVLGALVGGDARCGGRRLPGRVPEPARRPVPARRRRRGRARRDARRRLRAETAASPATCCRSRPSSARQSQSSSPTRSDARPGGRRAGGPRPRRRDRRVVLHGAADIRPAAARRNPPGGVLVAARDGCRPPAGARSLIIAAVRRSRPG